MDPFAHFEWPCSDPADRRLDCKVEACARAPSGDRTRRAGSGVVRGHPVAQLCCGVRSLRIDAGATEARKLIIARRLSKEGAR